ncbi:DUF4126 family protein [Caballeronia sp. M23-90]
MLAVIAVFLLGAASGLRALAGLAVVSWAAHLGYFHLEHTWLAFLGYAVTPYILTLLAVVEMVNDKRPKTPSRKVPPQFIVRVVTGTLCGAALGLSTGQLVVCLIVGAVGSVAGTLIGASARASGARLLGRDLSAALIEDATTIGLSVVAVFIALEG